QRLGDTRRARVRSELSVASVLSGAAGSRSRHTAEAWPLDAGRWNRRSPRIARGNAFAAQSNRRALTMCFQNLPIEFDANGKPTLVGGADAFSYTPVEIDRSQIEELVKRNAHVRD